MRSPNKEAKKKKSSKLVPETRPIRQMCPVAALTALFLSFLLSFQNYGSFSSYKPRCLVYEAAEAHADKKSILLVAALRYAAR